MSSNAYTQSQRELNIQASVALDKADDELNRVYNKLIEVDKTDTVFIAKLKKSQRIWIAFRDAELELKYPPRERGFYGSLLRLCETIFLEELTKERTKTLKKYLEGTWEGCM